MCFSLSDQYYHRSLTNEPAGRTFEPLIKTSSNVLAEKPSPSLAVVLFMVDSVLHLTALSGGVGTTRLAFESSLN
jgi:hypothetical protein